MPERIQRRRTAGWRMPTGAIYVGRPTKYGNPYTLGRIGDMRQWTGWFVGDHRDDQANYGQFPDKARAAEHAVSLYRDRSWSWSPDTVAQIRRDLAGRDLACWCPLDQPCHADVLLELANAPAETTPTRPHRDEPTFGRPITTVHLPAANIA